MNQANLENANKGLCVICDKHVVVGRMTCSENCHEEFIKFCENEYGIVKKAVDDTTGISYKVPIRDIVEKGLSWKDLNKYPQWKENEVI